MPAKKKLIQGVGTNAYEGQLYFEGKPLPSYKAWYSMLNRCYSGKVPAYENTTVCAEWLEFTVFKDWHDTNYIKGYHLDKDILGDGTLYSPATCSYVAGKVNCFLSFTSGGRGPLPVGVYQSKNKYIAQCRDVLGASPRNVGAFTDITTASNAWVARKLKYLDNFYNAGLVTYQQKQCIAALINKEAYCG